MNLLYLDWNSFCRKDVLDAFENLGHTYTLFTLPEKAKMLGMDAGTIDEICVELRNSDYAFAFSMNYFPMVSEACEKCGIPYLSWIYDNPYTKGYSINIINKCNYIFTFDSAMYKSLTAQGVQTIYYAPMAANAKRLSKGFSSPGEVDHSFSYDVSFVGALYNEDHNFYDEFIKNAQAAGKDYYNGYIDALINVQSELYGTNILSRCLPREIAECGFADINQWSEINSYFTTPEELFADNVLCRKITETERRTLLEKLSEKFHVTLFTRNKKAQVGRCHNLGYVDYYNEMPEVFRSSKINLNISLKSIKNGIPLRAMEILGSGGFLLTNYQSDFLLHFEPDIDFVYYEDLEDAVQKTGYYLEHDEERIQIAKNAIQKIKDFHTYEIRLNDMINTAIH